MRRVVQVARVVPVAGVLVLAGCGGDPSFDLGPTRACLRNAGVEVDTAGIGVVASTAQGGALHASFPGNEVTVAFGQDDEDADQTERAYRRFAPPRLRAKLPNVLKRRRNVVMLWGVSPSPQDEATVVGCLSG